MGDDLPVGPDGQDILVEWDDPTDIPVGMTFFGYDPQTDRPKDKVERDSLAYLTASRLGVRPDLTTETYSIWGSAGEGYG